MPQREPLFEILSQNFVCVCMCTCSVGVKTIGRKRPNNSSRKSSFQIDCIFKEAAEANCLQECARNLIVRTEVPLCFISLGHVQHLHKFMFHLKTALFYYCASVFNVELILLHFVCFFIFFFLYHSPFKVDLCTTRLGIQEIIFVKGSVSIPTSWPLLHCMSLY